MQVKTSMTKLTIVFALACLIALGNGCSTSKRIVIDASGKGNFKTIRDGLREWQEGQEIIIMPGNYDEQVILRSKMEIKGSGSDTTVVRFTGEGPAMVARDVGDIKVEGLSLLKDGKLEHSAVKLDSSDVEFDRCVIGSSKLAGVEGQRFGNVILNNTVVTDNGYAGLYFHHQARATISNSEIRDNEHGMIVKAWPEGVPQARTIFRDEDLNADISIISSNITKNKKDGLVADMAADLAIDKCKINDNGTAGLVLKNHSEVLLTENEITNNKTGLQIDNAKVEVIGNSISQSEKLGVEINRSSSVKVAANNIDRNRTGIKVTGSCDPKIQDNRLRENSENGIELIDGARAIVERNWIIGNEKVGVAIFNASKPLIKYNIVASNGWHGLLAARDSKPTVLNNTFYRNSKIGVWFLERSEGVFSQNAIVGSMIGLSVRRNFDYKPKTRFNLYFRNERTDYEGFGTIPPLDFNQDPMFTDPARLDFSPLPGSPLLRNEAGQNIQIGAAKAAVPNS